MPRWLLGWLFNTPNEYAPGAEIEEQMREWRSNGMHRDLFMASRMDEIERTLNNNIDACLALEAEMEKDHPPVRSSRRPDLTTQIDLIEEELHDSSQT